MSKQQRPHTRAALRMWREFMPTMIVWLVSVLLWMWLVDGEKLWMAIGAIVLTVPYLIEYRRRYVDHMLKQWRVSGEEKEQDNDGN